MRLAYNAPWVYKPYNLTNEEIRVVDKNPNKGIG